MTTTIYPIQAPSSVNKQFPQKKTTGPLPRIHDALYPAPPLLEPLKFTLSKPKLTPPSGNIIYGILDSLSNLWEVGNDRLKLHLGLLDKHRNTIDELNFEHTKLIKETAQKTQDGKVWSLLRKIGSCVLAAFSIFFGATVASPVLSGLFIASGILAIANLALSEAGLWDKVADKLFPDDQERRKKFVTFIPAALGILSAVCGATGGIAAFFTTGINLAKGTLAIANTAVNLAQGVTSIGEGINQGSVLFSEAEVKRLDKEMFGQQHKLEKITGGFEGVMKLLSESYAKAARIINMSISTGEEITLQA